MENNEKQMEGVTIIQPSTRPIKTEREFYAERVGYEKIVFAVSCFICPLVGTIGSATSDEKVTFVSVLFGICTAISWIMIFDLGHYEAMRRNGIIGMIIAAVFLGASAVVGNVVGIIFGIIHFAVAGYFLMKDNTIKSEYNHYLENGH